MRLDVEAKNDLDLNLVAALMYYGMYIFTDFDDFGFVDSVSGISQ